MRALRAAGIAVLAGLPRVVGADIEEKAIREVYSIHVNLASVVDLEELRLYLEEARRLLQKSQSASDDIPCCVGFEEIGLEFFGDPNDGLDIIDDPDEWIALGSRKAIVQTLNWCGSFGTALGCAQLPGSRLAVALDAQPFRLAQVLAHEFGHNAGLQHRDTPFCSLMRPVANPSFGCVDVAECNSYRALGSTGGSCECMGALVGDPAEPDGMPCTQGGAAGTCFDSGLCAPVPAEDLCAAALPLGELGATLGTDEGAGTEGSSSCATTEADVWYSHVPSCTGDLDIDSCDSAGDTVVSAHAACDGTAANELACNNDCPGGQIAGCRALASCLGAPVVFGEPIAIRVSAVFGGRGPFVLRLGACVTDESVDSDGDGLPDFFEYGTLGTDHLDPDSDGDGFDDGVDNCPTVSNPGQMDNDGDGMGDVCQCGDVNDDGILDMLDAVLIARDLDGRPPGLPVPERCNVTGPPVCDAADLAVIREALVEIPDVIDPGCAPAGG